MISYCNADASVSKVGEEVGLTWEKLQMEKNVKRSSRPSSSSPTSISSSLSSSSSSEDDQESLPFVRDDAIMLE